MSGHLHAAGVRKQSPHSGMEIPPPLKGLSLQETTTMVNTLTRMIPDLYKSLDIVSRELVGSCRLSPSTHAPPALAVGQAVVVPITPASTVSDITPGESGPNDGDQAIGNTTIITRSRGVPFRWNGEEQRGVVGWDGVSCMVPLDDDEIDRAALKKTRPSTRALWRYRSRSLPTTKLPS
jgi:hypothetical protein